MKIPENMLKFGNFQKSRFFGGSEGGNVISNPPKWFHISIFIVSGGLGAEKCCFEKFWVLKNVIFQVLGGPGGSPSEKFLPKTVS